MFNRRCYYYDLDGEPINGGCPKPSAICKFVHPDEKGWSTATISHSRRRYSKRSPSPPSFERHRDSGYSRHRHHKSRSRSRSPPPPRIRRDSVASSILDNLGSPVSGDPPRPSLTDMTPPNIVGLPARPSSPKTQKEQPQASSSLMNSTSSLPTPPQTAVQTGDIPNRGRWLNTLTASKISIPSLPRAMRPPPSRPSIRISPPPPSKVPPPLPPPPQSLPAIPSALSAGVESSAPVQPTAEEKRAMWEERIRILSEVELAREQLAALEEQHVFALKIMESHYFTSLPREDKDRLKIQLAELETQRDEAKKLHEEWAGKLFKTGSWPVAPPSSVEDGMEEKHKEIVKYIQELKDTALQMNKILGDISTLKSPPQPPLFLSSDSDHEGGTAMDVDQPDSAHPKSLKPRRISENLDKRSGGGGSAPSLPTQEELDEFLERLANMEGLISTLQNDITQHGREAREEFEQLMDAKFDEIQATREAEERQRKEEEQQRIQHLEQDITLTGEQVGELATEIGDLIVRVGELEVDVGAARKRREESFGKVLEVERRLQEYISTRDANVHTIQTFEKALNAYTSRPPSPPATPLNVVVPCFDYIYQSLEEPLAESLRSQLVPAIEDLRKDVENIVRTQNAELYSTLWNKITVTLKALEMIQSRINRGDLTIEPGQSLVGSAVVP